jgi:hypothetical protein
MTSLGIQKNKETFKTDDDVDIVRKGTWNSTDDLYYPWNSMFKKPPLETILHEDVLTKEIIRKAVETICLNILLNSKEYPEVFTLIRDFGTGYWSDLFEIHKSNLSDKGVIRLRQ